MFLHFDLVYSRTVVWARFLNFLFSVFHIYPGKIVRFFNIFFFASDNAVKRYSWHLGGL